MAIICTNNLLGNDTTGNGSAATPYKTINKAISVAADNDTIKVAGGQFVQVTGTVTTTARGTTMSTSVDMTGSISLYDVIAIDTSAVDGWDKEKTLFTVEGITSTTITVGTLQPIQFKVGTYNIWRLNAYHYSTTATTAQETITTITPSTLTISGGWSSDFTTQIGWTCARYATVGNSGLFITLSNLIKPNVVFDKFLMSKSSFNHTSSNGSIGINTINFVYSLNTFGTSNYGIYNPSGGTTTIIANSSTNMASAWNGGGNRPTTLLLNQYITGHFAAGSSTFLKTGYLSILGDTAPSIRTSNAYIRTSGNSSNSSGSYVISPTNLGDVFIDYLNITINNSSILGLYGSFSTDTAWRYVGNIDVQTDGTAAGIYPLYNTVGQTGQNTASFPLNINRTSGKLDALPWRIYGTTPEIDYFYKSCNSTIYGKDTEGYKVITADGIPRYADNSTYQTGSNSLRQKLLTNTSGGDTIRHLLGTLVKPNAPFTVNITIKGSKNIPSSCTSFSLLYGPAQTQVLTLASNPNITTSWATLSYNVTPASYSNWSFGDDGLMSIFYNASSGATGIADEDYFWVDAITIT